jgi:ribosomal protein L40E
MTPEAGDTMGTDQLSKQQCARCGASVDSEARFCQDCGAAVIPGVERTCRECAAALSPSAQFCPRCGTRQTSGALAAGVRDGWSQFRSRAAAVDWPRVGRTVLPVAALILAGLLGYALGLRAASPAATGSRIVSAARGWRSDTPTGPAASGSPATARPEPAPPPIHSAALPSSTRAPLTRYRDFKIAGSSYELANPPARAADGDPYTAWHAWETERYPDGEWLTLTFPNRRHVSRIGLIPGMIGPHAGRDGRVRSILVKAPGAPPQKLLFANQSQLQYRDLPKPVDTRTLTLRIVTVTPGYRTRHIVVPEVQVWGQPANQVAAR